MKWFFWLIGILAFLFLYENIRGRVALYFKNSIHYLNVWFSKGAAKLISILMRKLWRMREMLVTENRNPELLSGLNATDQADESGVYERSILSGLNAVGVSNIALCGPYGSGKSSIVRTFVRRHPELKFLNISLAAISPDLNGHQNTESPAAEKVLEGNTLIKNWTGKLSEQIEYSILQQMFYHVREQQIPFSRFKRVRGKSRVGLWALTVSMFLLLLAACYLFFHTNLSLLPKDWADWLQGYDDTLKRASWFLIIIAVIGVIFTIIKLYRDAQLIKINLNSAQLEIAPKRDSSALNKHLDEILYFFSEVGIDVVIVEDLDRFANPEIFVKLREINILINNSKEVGRKVTFIYALRDDIFTNEERTKFFDMLVPVIPVTNASNAAARLNTAIAAMPLKDPVSSLFLNDLALFIQDTRLLINIVNEFRVYQALLDDFETKSSDLLAIIVYKNKFPSDFSELQYNRGIIYEHFKQKQDFVNRILKSHNEERDAVVEKLSGIRSTFFESIKELRMIYIAQLYHEIYLISGGFKGRIYVGQVEKNLKDLVEDDNFNYLVSGNRIQYRDDYNTKHNYPKTFSDLETQVGGASYKTRHDRLSTLFQTQSTSLESRLEKINQIIREANNFSMQEVMVHPEMRSAKTLLDPHPLLMYLVRNGHINENYSYYLSQFTEGEITKSDFDFLWAVKDGRNLPWNHQLTKLPALVKRFSDKEYSLPPMLNIDMANYLVGDKSVDNKRRLSMFMELLNPVSEQSVDFIHQVVQQKKNSGDMMEAVCEYVSEFWDFIETNSNYTSDKKYSYLVLIIQHAKLPHIILQNKSGQLKTYMSGQISLLNPDKNGLNKVVLQNICKALHVKFKFAEESIEMEEEMCRFIYTHSLYEINPRMLSLILSRVLPGYSEAEFNQTQFSNIMTGELDHMKEYITENISQYVSEVFLQIEGGSFESEGPMLRMIVSDKLTLEMKEQVIRKTVFEIENIHHSSDRRTWNALMDSCRVAATWDNVFKYYDNTKSEDGAPTLSSAFISFLNNQQVAKKLTQDTVENTTANESIVSMLSDIILSGKLNVSVFRDYLRAYPRDFEQIDYAHFDKEKSIILLEGKKVVLNPATFASLKKYHPVLVAGFVFSQWDKFEQIYNQLDLSVDEWNALFRFQASSAAQREFLCVAVPREILTNILSSGVVFSDSALKSRNDSFEFVELTKLAENHNVNRSNVSRLIVNSIPRLDQEQIGSLLKAMGKEVALIPESTGLLRISYSEVVEDLLKQLEAAGVLIESHESNDKVIIIQLKNR